jgi:5'-methylthioadenosine phosphorylase
VSFADPVCAGLVARVAAAAEAAGFEPGADEARDVEVDEATEGTRPARVYQGGTYVCMEGPQFSTRAESLLHRSMGADVIGMTGATEAKLAREAELCFAAVALATDYDCWHEEHDEVTTADVLRVLSANIAHAKTLVKKLAATMAEPLPPCGCESAAAHAILTAKTAVSEEARQRLAFLFGRYL